MAEKKNATQSVFETLKAIDCSEHTEKKNGLTYLSWAWAWAEVKKRYPDATYTIYHDEQHRPYFEDTELGFMCYTSVTILGETLEMWLPVMDSANNAMKRNAYDFSTFSKYGEKKHHVNAATMFDINKTIMRCLVKNLAMFGLGHYIYAGEDLPEEVADQLKAEQEMARQEELKKFNEALDKALAELSACKSIEEFDKLVKTHQQFWNNETYKKAGSQIKAQLVA